MFVLGNKTVIRWDVIAAVFLMAFLAACDADRDNPYDPKSPYFKPGGRLTGWVKTRSGMPIEGAKVLVEPDNIYCLSGSDGFYEIKGVATENTKVTASREGFSTKDTMLMVTLGKENKADFLLNILPAFVSCNVTTRHKSNGRYYVFFETEVFDGDGSGLEDIDAVSFYVKGYADTFPLKYYEPSGTHRREMDDSCFSSDSLRGLIGKECFFMVRDKAHEVVISEPCRVVRIIDKQPATIKPSGWERVGQSPELFWESFGESFHFSYAVNVRDVNFEIVYPKSNIDSDSLSIKVMNKLAPGEYSWTVSVVDEFENQSESRSATFVVE